MRRAVRPAAPSLQRENAKAVCCEHMMHANQACQPDKGIALEKCAPFENIGALSHWARSWSAGFFLVTVGGETSATCVRSQHKPKRMEGQTGENKERTFWVSSDPGSTPNCFFDVRSKKNLRERARTSDGYNNHDI